MHLRGKRGGRKETEHDKMILIFKSKQSCISILQRLRKKKNTKYKLHVHTCPHFVASLYQGSEVCPLTPENTKRKVLAKNLLSR